jgi:hypothetical protein
MGLDWFVQSKRENGRDVMPRETAGPIVLDRDDPLSIEVFKQLHEKRKKEFPDPGAPPVAPAEPRGFARIKDRFSGQSKRRRDEYEGANRRWRRQKDGFEYWHRSFETVLEDALVSVEDSESGWNGILQHAAVDRQDALAEFLGTGGPYDFRANELREDFNPVTVFASHELGFDYGLFIASDLTPDEMLQMADDMETALKKFHESGADLDDEDVEFGIEITESAVRYLRFWGGHGHGLVADW